MFLAPAGFGEDFGEHVVVIDGDAGLLLLDPALFSLVIAPIDPIQKFLIGAVAIQEFGRLFA